MTQLTNPAPSKIVLKPDTLLVRVSELHMRLHSNQFVDLYWQGRRIKGNQYTLPILDQFNEPKSFKQATQALSKLAVSSQAWFALMNTILHLYHLGILREFANGVALNNQTMHGYDDPRIHIAMLNDVERTRLWTEALKQTVQPSDIVVDIGTGSGVLAIAAAKAGAKHVYAIEVTQMATVAKNLIEENEVSDLVTVIRDWSTNVELPERATVMVSEMVGDGPLDERILEITQDAKNRLLTTDARYIPAGLRIYAQAIQLPESIIAKHLYQPQYIQRWQDDYDIKFETLLTQYANYVGRVTLYPQALANAEMLSEPLLLWDIDFKQDLDETVDPQVSGTVDLRDGSMNGLIIFTQILLDDTRILSLHPHVADKRNHWRIPTLMFATPQAVKVGQQIHINGILQGLGSHTQINLQYKVL